MSLEQYANNPTTTLNGSITAVATSLTVTDASAFPSVPQFRILIDSEILLVTAVAGNVFTVSRGQEDTVGASHTNNATVEGVLSRSGLLNALSHNVRAFGAVADGTTDDLTAIQNAIDNAPAGATVILPPGVYVVGSTSGSKLTITKEVHLVGYGATLKAGADSMDGWIDIDSCDNWSIEGIFFDDADRAMTIVDANICDNFRITNCRFSGFNAGTTTTTSQSAIRLATCTNGVIGHNLFREFGEQYPDSGVDPTKLNRCITLNLGCDDVVIDSNVFSEVNQAIVISGNSAEGYNIISNNIFRDVTDNAIYLVITPDGCLIEGNQFVRTAAGPGSDEAIVMSNASNVTITGNIFKEIPNKMIAYEGSCNNINIVGNTFIKLDAVETGGNFLSYRIGTDSIENLMFIGNTVRGDKFGTIAAKLVDATNAIFSDNIFALNMSGTADATILRFESDNDSVIFRGNLFSITGGVVNSNYGVRMDVATTCTNFYFDGNHYKNCSTRWASHAPIIRNENENGSVRSVSATNKVVHGSAAPTSGPWLRGDIMFNTAPSAAGTVGWVCTASGSPGTWKTFGSIAA